MTSLTLGGIVFKELGKIGVRRWPFDGGELQWDIRHCSAVPKEVRVRFVVGRDVATAGTL